MEVITKSGRSFWMKWPLFWATTSLPLELRLERSVCRLIQARMYCVAVQCTDEVKRHLGKAASGCIDLRLHSKYVVVRDSFHWESMPGLAAKCWPESCYQAHCLFG